MNTSLSTICELSTNLHKKNVITAIDYVIISFQTLFKNYTLFVNCQQNFIEGKTCGSPKVLISPSDGATTATRY